ncbi:MAG: hypothetical protein H6733_10550 [Alphaproteobacteria bacterium]|nr:hypothetical protein [Alphaproteobacteria bacterium]
MPDDSQAHVKVFTAPPRPTRFPRRPEDDEDATERTTEQEPPRRKRGRR